MLSDGDGQDALVAFDLLRIIAERDQFGRQGAIGQHFNRHATVAGDRHDEAVTVLNEPVQGLEFLLAVCDVGLERAIDFLAHHLPLSSASAIALLTNSCSSPRSRLRIAGTSRASPHQCIVLSRLTMTLPAVSISPRS